MGHKQNTPRPFLSGLPRFKPPEAAAKQSNKNRRFSKGKNGGNAKKRKRSRRFV